MRDLDAINLFSRRQMTTCGAMLCLFSTLFVYLFLTEHDGQASLPSNAALWLAACSILLFFVPFWRGWDWQMKYVGVGILGGCSMALLGIVPCLWLVFSDDFPLGCKVLMLLVYVVAHLPYCRRVVLHDRTIRADHALFSLLYQEEADAVYYQQQVDKHFQVKLFDSSKRRREHERRELFAVGAMVLAIVLGLVLGQMATYADLPGIPVLFAVMGLPFSVFMVRLGMRTWLLYYWHPMHIRRRTGKRVYMDQGSLPEDLKETMRRWRAANLVPPIRQRDSLGRFK